MKINVTINECSSQHSFSFILLRNFFHHIIFIFLEAKVKVSGLINILFANCYTRIYFPNYSLKKIRNFVVRLQIFLGCFLPNTLATNSFSSVICEYFFFFSPENPIQKGKQWIELQQFFYSNLSIVGLVLELIWI